MNTVLQNRIDSDDHYDNNVFFSEILKNSSEFIKVILF